MPENEEAHEEAHEEASEETPSEEAAIEVPEDFDPERALKTIHAQREAEAKALARAKEAEAKLAAIEQAEAEAQKTLEQKLEDREARIAELEASQAAKDVRTDFIAKAAEKGIADPQLAYLAAKEEDLLGAYDPKTGDVGNHDFEALGEKYPTFAAAEEGEEQETGGFGGDAGVRGKRTKRTPGSVFNSEVRATINGL